VRITVIGCGYLGATHAASMADLGHEVLGVEIDEARRKRLTAGEVPIHEPGLPELLSRHVSSGRLRFVDSFEEAGAFGDLHFLCVGTPQSAQGLGADLSQVFDAVESLAPHLKEDAVVVGKSTVPVGTAARLAQRLDELSVVTARLVWNPEFLREGFALDDTLHPGRIVLGLATPGYDSLAERLFREIYAEQIAGGTPVVISDLATAELTKVAANAFLATKISFINAMAEICEALGADVTLLADALGYDPRIGRAFLNAGLGFGGGCLPKDIRAFMARAGELGAGDAVTFLREVDAINQRRRQRVVDMVGELLGRPWPGSRLAVLGAAFKPDSDDIRDSPALNVAGRLHLFGAHVTVHDPQAMDNARRLWPTLSYAESVREACAGAHVVLVLTEWQQFREVDPAALASGVAQQAVVDGRNCLDPATWRAAGWTYRALGRP